MPAPVYSKAFWVGTNVTGFAEGPVVPAGKVWVVRDIQVLCLQDQTHPLGFFVLGSNTWPYIYTIGNGRMHGYSPVEWHGRVVLPAGDQLYYSFTGPFWNFYIGGYELTSPP